MNNDYKKTRWIDHIVDESTEEVIQEGTPISARNMNNIEDGIENITTKIKNIITIDNSIGIGKEAKVKGNFSTVIGYKSEGEKNYTTSVGYSTVTRGISGIAIGDNIEVKKDWSAGIGQRLVISHNCAFMISPAKEGYSLSSSTTNNQILLGSSSVYTPYSYKALSVISDKRDRAEIKKLRYDSLEFINKLKPRQYKNDVRSEYTRIEELTEEEYNKLDEYNKKHKVIEKKIYSINDEIKFIELENYENKLNKNLDRYKSLIKSNVFTSKEEALRFNKVNIEEIEIKEVDEMKLLIKELPKDGSKRGLRLHNGFIAQEVKEVAEDMGFDFAGVKYHKINGGDDIYSLTYEEFIAPIVGAIQQLTEKVNYLEEQLEKNKK